MAEVDKVGTVPTEEAIQEKVEEVDGRTTLGKRLKAIEDTLSDHDKRIKVCEVRR